MNIFRYVRTAEPEINLAQVHAELVVLDAKIKAATQKHDKSLKELSLPELP